MKGRGLFAGLCLASFFVAGKALAQGCAMCGTAVGSDATLAGAFNRGILLLLAGPYLLAGALGGWIVYAYWKRAKEKPRARILPFSPDERGGNVR
ncbi:MAG: hypothetical protein KatS3mg076_0337 [Candidatus Binatia bacterium]|nr:MAG: hypothetical protein KatS3mg076_0337 [Candidatus Binatia bacterium]